MALEPNAKLDIGQIGERVVAHWLRSQGFVLYDERWHCRLGELDLVASERVNGESILAFVEVKARRARNWDADGLMAITATKQRKLIKAAQLYLSHHPEFDQYPCRFDVALVQIVGTEGRWDDLSQSSSLYQFGRDRLRLKHYIRDAFALDY